MGSAFSIVGTIIAIYVRLTNKITRLEEKVESLEIQTKEDRKERKDLTNALHEISESIALLKGYLEGHSSFKPTRTTRKQTVK